MTSKDIRITHAQIQSWAGEGVFKRGQRYEHRGRVRDLATTQDGDLVAWVEGSRRYATRVNLHAEPPTSDCTCPYGGVCKHAVAVALVYLNRLEETPLPTAPTTDPRIILLDRPTALGSDIMGNIVAQNKAFQDFLASYTQAELVELVAELADRFSEVRDAIAVRQMLANGDAARLEAEVLNRIITVSAEPAWDNHWNDDGHIPDYAPVQDGLRHLLDQGYADAVVRLGKQLLEDGIEQIEQSHDDGDTGFAIASCLAIVFEALPSSSLELHEQIMWAINAMLRDHYDLCHGAQDVLDESYSTATWSIVADQILSKLDSLPVVTNDFSRKYERDRVTDFAILALEEAGRAEEIIPLCERETKQSGSYQRLIKLLLAAGRRAEAEQWARTGIEATAHQYPGIAGALIEVICTLRGEAGDWDMVAAFRAQQFFEAPSISTLRALEAAAAHANQVPPVRAAAMHYLEHGQPPKREARRVGGTTIPAWTLPDTGIVPTTRRYPLQFPQVVLLIALAIDEQRPDEVLRWYDRRGTVPHLRLDEDAIATAVARTYPERAAAIWQGLAEAKIAQTNTSAYEEAAQVLRKLRLVWTEQGKGEDWRLYVEGLRTSNKRKRRLTEILDILMRENA